jgi:uncharacterized protein involved in type VI secretion and phage assembly
MLDVIPPDGARSSYVPGVVIGVVTRIDDPDGLGRVKVKLPRFSDDEESAWARVVSFMAGASRGAVFIPEVDDEVLVAFEFGDISLPYVIGGLHSQTDQAPYANPDGANNIRVIKSRSGHIIRLDDTDGSEKIEIIDKTGTNKIVFDASANKISIESGGDLELKAESGTLKLAAKDVEIEASGDLKASASGDVNVEASGDMKLEGSEIALN